MAGSRNLELRTRKVFVVVIDIARNRAACVAAVFVICQQRANIVNSSNVERGLVSSRTRAHTHTHTRTVHIKRDQGPPGDPHTHTHTSARTAPNMLVLSLACTPSFPARTFAAPQSNHHASLQNGATGRPPPARHLSAFPHKIASICNRPKQPR